MPSNSPEHIADINAMMARHIAEGDEGAQLTLLNAVLIPGLEFRIEAATWDGAQLAFTEFGALNEFGTHRITANRAEVSGSCITFWYCDGDIKTVIATVDNMPAHFEL